jgi:hypothetical protein
MATKCFRCQEYGHMAAQCTAERGGGGYSAGNCFKCGRRGHFANECTSNGSSSGSNSRLSGRKRGRDVDEGDRMYFYADDDNEVDDGYYHVPGDLNTGGYSRRGNNSSSNKTAGYAELDKPLPTYRQSNNNGNGRNYSSGDQRRRRR